MQKITIIVTKIMTTKKLTFHIQGMHCKACVILTESELGDLPNITGIKASLIDHSIEIDGDFGDRTPEQIASELNTSMKPHGYIISTEKKQHKVSWSDFKIAIPIALGFVAIFIALQQMGLIDLVAPGTVTYGTAFVIGIIASLSSCMAVVGGLVLSMSATFAKGDDATLSKPTRQTKLKPHLMFHVGRIVSFFILGGVIGALGASFTLGTSTTFVLSFIIGIVMLILGINLLDTFSWAKRLQPSMPRSIAKYAHGVYKFNHTLTPLLVGIATFFLPCGFTQSMQLYTLTTGGFFSGGLTMLMFALGTLPVLAIISFSSFGIQKSSWGGIFFKTSGLIVIMFALFNIINSLVVIGLVPPIFNF